MSRVITSSGSSPSRVYIVDKEGNADYLSIQAAIDKAFSQNPSTTDPYTILISPGTYTENLTLSDNVHLSGLYPDDSVILKPPSSYLFKPASCTLSHLHLQNADTVIIESGPGNLTLDHVQLTSSLDGINITHADFNLEIRYCRFQSTGNTLVIGNGNANIRHSFITNSHNLTGQPITGAIKITGGSASIHYSSLENRTPSGPAVIIENNPTIKLYHSILYASGQYSITATASISPIIANTLSNSPLDPNINNIVSFIWDSSIT